MRKLQVFVPVKSRGLREREKNFFIDSRLFVYLVCR